MAAKKTKRKAKKRSGLAGSTSNDFCRSQDLGNEASVESFFVLRLLDALGYKDAEIRTKSAIDELRIGKGRKKEPYRPDYLLYCKRKPRWIIDAKATSENPDDYVDQGSSYSLAANVKYEDNPVHYFMLTNGFLTRVYRWDKEQPILSLRFSDFVQGNTKYKSLQELLGAEAARDPVQLRAPVLDADVRKRMDDDRVKAESESDVRTSEA